jgi:hypothetical protein
VEVRPGPQPVVASASKRLNYWLTARNTRLADDALRSRHTPFYRAHTYSPGCPAPFALAKSPVCPLSQAKDLSS